jgi:hypothetical protein
VRSWTSQSTLVCMKMGTRKRVYQRKDDEYFYYLRKYQGTGWLGNSVDRGPPGAGLAILRARLKPGAPLVDLIFFTKSGR